jgi:outer membrane lipoprotein LolB
MFARDISPKIPESLIKRVTAYVVCLVVLGACAGTRPSTNLPEFTTWQQRLDVLGGASDWEFHGRIAVKAGDDGFNGKFNWAQTKGEFQATLSGPLGIGTVRIEGNGRRVSLTDKEGLTTELLDPETELFDRYGWTIPVASLRYWVLGIPDPKRTSTTELDDSGRLVSLAQNEWTLTISRYRESAGQQMPRTLTVTNPDTRVRMVIDKWMFYD